VDEREGLLDVEVPGFRPDIRQEVDLIEEVARLAGFERLRSTIPHGDAGGLEAQQSADRLLRRAFASLGANEAWTTSLGNAQDLDRLELAADHPARRMVGLANPMSDLEDKMRTTLLPGLLRAAARNVARRVDNVALFEIARVFEASSELLPEQPTNLGGVFVGERSSTTWNHPAVAWDFFEVKGLLSAAIASIGITMELAPAEGMPFHPTRAAAVSIGAVRVGAIGELHPRVCERFDVPEGTVVFEIAVAPMLAVMPARPAVPELPRFPASFIDLAVVVAEDVAAAGVEQTIRSAGAPELESVRLFDVYRGEQIEAGKKSLAYALQMRVPDRTLTDEDAVAVRERIVGALQDRFQAELRA
jgi:phenylalanyl-tRNA synthetase beta chain